MLYLSVTVDLLQFSSCRLAAGRVKPDLLVSPKTRKHTTTTPGDHA